MTVEHEASRPPGRRAVFRRALENAALRRVLAAYLLFNVAEWANWIALLVWAYGRDGVRGAGVLAIVQLVPASLLAPVVARRLAGLGPGRAVRLGYAAQAVAYLATGTALALSAPYAVVAVLAATSAVAITMTRPVHNAVLPALADTTEELTAANAVSGSLEAAAVFLGPLVCAVLVAARDVGAVLLAMALAAAAATLLTLRLPARSTGPVRLAEGSSEVYSVRAVLDNPTARTLTVLVAAEYVLVGMLDILLVELALGLLSMSTSGPGLLNAAVGLGGLLGAGLTALLVGRSRLAPALAAGAVVAGLLIALSGTTSVPAVAVLLLAGAGAGKLFVDVASRTLVQRALPDRMLVAVFGVQESTMMAGLAVGSLLAPVLVGTAGARWAFVAAGSFLPLVTVLSWQGLRRADAQATVPPDVYRLLRRVPFLAVLPPRVVERLALEATATSVAAGEVVIREGARGDDFYVLAAGSADVSRSGRSWRRLGAGDWFGELALLRDAPRSATVTATDDGELLVLGRVPFLMAVTGAPASMAAADEQATRYEFPPQ